MNRVPPLQGTNWVAVTALGLAVVIAAIDPHRSRHRICRQLATRLESSRPAPSGSPLPTACQ